MWVQVPPLPQKFNFMINFLKKKKKENLNELKKEIEKIKENLFELSKKIDEIEKKQSLCIQKLGFVRYNPFENIGGNQSFSLALLDGDDNGIVISSFFTREGLLLFAKQVNKGTSSFNLSPEEKLAIEKAKNSKKYDNDSKTTSSSIPRSHR